MNEMDRQQFGAFLSELRKEKGFTQKELAQKLFVSDKAVSKWECGNGMPDISMLIPIAQTLEVTVTELLECRRSIAEQPIDPKQADEIVKRVIFISEEEHNQNQKIKIKRGIIFGIAVLFSVLEVNVLLGWSNSMEMFLSTGITYELLGLFFGFYFTFMAKEKLPTYYDENKISVYSDGALRMNIPGVHFNNSNWPHIVRIGWLWSVWVLILCPLLYGLCDFLIPGGDIVYLCVSLPAFLIGLFVPIYVVGKKYA